MTALLIILALVLLLAGLAGAVHPLLPGMPLMFAGTWLLAYSQDYEVIGTTALTVLGLIMALAWTLDYMAGAVGLSGGRRCGAVFCAAGHGAGPADWRGGGGICGTAQLVGGRQGRLGHAFGLCGGRGGEAGLCAGGAVQHFRAVCVLLAELGFQVACCQAGAT